MAAKKNDAEEMPDENTAAETPAVSPPPVSPAPHRPRETPAADGVGVAVADLHDRAAALERDVAELKGRPVPGAEKKKVAWYDVDLWPSEEQS
jgi:hypothetical protein